MNMNEIVASVDAEIARFERARALLTGQTVPLKRGMPPATQRRTLSAESRARMAAAQKKRWAKIKG